MKFELIKKSRIFKGYYLQFLVYLWCEFCEEDIVNIGLRTKYDNKTEWYNEISLRCSCVKDKELTYLVDKTVESIKSAYVLSGLEGVENLVHSLNEEIETNPPAVTPSKDTEF